MTQIFISYAREDRDTAERLAHALETVGWSVWWDRRIPAGKRFDEVIAGQLNAAGCVLALWSGHGVASQWVAEEAEAARERGVLLPAMIAPVEPPLGFRRIHAADLIGWQGDAGHAGFRQLCHDIAGVLAGRPGARSAALAASAATGAAAPGRTEPEMSPSGPLAPPPSRRLRFLKLAVAGVAIAGAIALVLAAPAWHDDASRKSNAREAAAPSLDGRWLGRVAYDWGAAYDETFTFHTVGNTLTGSAGFLGVPRAIVGAERDGREVRFSVHWREMLGDKQREATGYYVGALGNDGSLGMVLTIDGSFSAHPPVAFALTRAVEP
jgi:hypothetical protein